jgi:hypothetical protein
MIPHAEKVFSIFEPHTEMIIKGKAGVEFELGLNVCVVKDQHGFTLHHHVMEHETDDQVAVEVLAQAKKKFPEINAASYDRGFYTPENKLELSQMVDNLCMPRKGRPAPEESETGFIAARRAHSAVESAINELEHRGLDICLDSGLHGFKRYVSMAVVAGNLHTLGSLFFKKENKRRRRIDRYNATRNANRQKNA